MIFYRILSVSLPIIVALGAFSFVRDIRAPDGKVDISKGYKSGENIDWNPGDTRLQSLDSYKGFVLDILRTRRSQPVRTPDEWMQFRASLDTWYRLSSSDCINTLTEANLTAALSLVQLPPLEHADNEIKRIAMDNPSSLAQIEALEELWRRATHFEPARSSELVQSMPKIHQARFRDRLLQKWVDAKGLSCLHEITITGVFTYEDMYDSYLLCAKTMPRECIAFLESDAFRKLQDRFGGGKPSRLSLLRRACEKLPVEEGLAVLNAEPPSASRDNGIGYLLLDYVKKNPQGAVNLLKAYPDTVPFAANSVYSVSFANPSAAAEILNLIQGEKQRTEYAREVAFGLPLEKATLFVNSLSDAYTKESVRSALSKVQRKASERREKK